MLFDVSKLRSLDTETYCFSAGNMAPPIVCGSWAWQDVNGQVRGELLGNKQDTINKFKQLLEDGYILAFANASYDLCCFAAANESLLPLIFKAIRNNQIFDILIAQALEGIYQGNLGLDPNTGGDLRNSEGKTTKRYNLYNTVYILFGRKDAKEHDYFRSSYALLEGFSPERWPEVARIYAIDDAVNTLACAIVQISGPSQKHCWKFDEEKKIDLCEHCGSDWGTVGEWCSVPKRPHENLDNMAAQVEAAFCLQLGACWGLRTDRDRVEALAEEVEKKHAEAVKRFQKLGWVKEDGKEDSAAIKRAVALAYGATGKCSRCGGGSMCEDCGGSGVLKKENGKRIEGGGNESSNAERCIFCKGTGFLIGKIRSKKRGPCRGEKIKGRYAGCKGEECKECSGTGFVTIYGDFIGCKNVFRKVKNSDGEEVEEQVEIGCDGTGLNLSTAPLLPRTDKGGVKTDRDAAMESGDDDVADFADNIFKKIRETYVPFLRKGIDQPLTFSPNVIVASGRCSYEGSPVHQFPRKGGVRECIIARPGKVICSTDYAAGELVTLSQIILWTIGYSRMAEIINSTKDPGSLHTFLGSKMLGISFEEMKKRIQEKNTQAKDFRQAAKCASFGYPGGLGSPTLVIQNRKLNVGTTKLLDGRELAGIRFCVLIGGVQKCGVEKITKWGRRDNITPVCKACVEVVEEVLKPAFFDAYPEVKDYLHWIEEKVADETDIKHPKKIPQLVWNKIIGSFDVSRRRGGCERNAAANTIFQGLLADIGKMAYSQIVRESYLGVKDDGTLSPLAGARPVLFLHDEPLVELDEETAHLSGPRIADIMCDCGKELAPDLHWRAEAALSFIWSKDMESVYDNMGKLIPWIPKQKL